MSRYRSWYAGLLRLYPRSFHEQFGEGMEQSFNDLCNERQDAGKGLCVFVFWVFTETAAAILKERSATMFKKTSRLIVWSAVAALILMLLVAMRFTTEVQWNEAVAYAVLFVLAGGTYELFQWLRLRTTVYRLAFGVGIVGALVLLWVNGAVGIIGSEDNPVNMLFVAVPLIGFVGAIIARFRSKGMVFALIVTAVAQASVPVIAYIINQPPIRTADDLAGILGVFAINSLFVLLFITSALLFRKASAAGLR